MSTNKSIGLLLLYLIPYIGASDGFKLRVAEFRVSSKGSAGMDGGLLGALTLGGGEFRIKICNELSSICCETRNQLETMNNDWERSETNYFIGRSLQECENFMMRGKVALTLIHEGSDGGELDSIRLYGSDFGYGKNHRREYLYPIREKLDNDDRKTVHCVLSIPSKDLSRACNGEEKFCNIQYNKFTFLGAHNAGTGEDTSSIPQINCAFKNQDLNIKEQLDFGTRFFDFDVIQSEKLYNCDGLETGHGRYPSLGLYRCFGKMALIIEELITWLNEMGNRDVVTLYFGAIDFEGSTYPPLRDIFRAPHIQEKLNTAYKLNRTWPTLGNAIEMHKNVFVFMRTDTSIEEAFLHREVPFDEIYQTPICEKDVIITSTYKNGAIDSDCQSSLIHAETLCHNEGDLLKVAAFGRGFSELLCLWESARICNPRLRDVLKICQSKASYINFVQMDFPNYLGLHGSTPIDIINDFNRQIHL